MATVTTNLRMAQDWLTEAKSPRAKLARNSFWAMGGSVLSQGSAMGAALVLGRELGVGGFGQLALIQSSVLLLSNLGELGLSMTTTKFVSRWRTSEPERAGSFLGSALVTTAALGLLTALGLALLEPYVTRGLGRSLVLEFIAALGFLVFDMLNRVQLGALAGLEAFSSSAMVYLCRAAVLLPGVWVGAQAGGLLGAMVAMSVVSFLTFLAGQVMVRRECASAGIPMSYGWVRERAAFATSISIWGGSVLLNLAAWIITLLLSRAALTELGLYNAADKWRTVLVFLPQVLFQVILPMLSHRHASGDLRACRRITVAALGAGIAVTGCAAIFVHLKAGWLMSAYGAAFAQGALVLSIAAGGAVINGVYTIASGALWAVGKPSRMLATDFLRTGVYVAICATSIALTAQQVMLAYVISFSVASVVLLWMIRRELRG